MPVALAHDVSAAREAQKLFFEIGMAERTRAGKALNELGLTFVQAHALRTLDPDRPLPMSTLAELLVCDASNVTGIDRRPLRERSTGASRHPAPSRCAASLRRVVATHRDTSELGRARESALSRRRPLEGFRPQLAQLQYRQVCGR